MPASLRSYVKTQLNAVRRDSQRQQSRQVLAFVRTSLLFRHLSCLWLCWSGSSTAALVPAAKRSYLTASSYYAAPVLRAAWPPWLRYESSTCAGCANLPRRLALRLAPFAVVPPSFLARLLAGLPPRVRTSLAACRPVASSPAGAPAGSAVANRSSTSQVAAKPAYLPSGCPAPLAPLPPAVEDKNMAVNLSIF